MFVNSVGIVVYVYNICLLFVWGFYVCEIIVLWICLFIVVFECFLWVVMLSACCVGVGMCLIYVLFLLLLVCVCLGFGRLSAVSVLACWAGLVVFTWLSGLGCLLLRFCCC